MGKDAADEMREFLVGCMADDIWTAALQRDLDLPPGIAQQLATAAYEAIPEEIAARMYSDPLPEGADAEVDA